MSKGLKDNSMFGTKYSMPNTQRCLWHYIFKCTVSKDIINADTQCQQLAHAPPKLHFGYINHHPARHWSPLAGNGSGNQHTQLVIQGASGTAWVCSELNHRADGLFLKCSVMHIHHTPAAIQNLGHRTGPFQRKNINQKNVLLRRYQGRRHEQKWHSKSKINNGGGDFLPSEEYM